uniref:Si:ch211-172l8.4 n=1 Tax=Labrus bergylta TaxID=56723 RepID=A0A3Q3ETV6_9LABR
FASCYVSARPLPLFRKGARGANYLSLFTYHGPPLTPKPRLACHAPKMTLRQICRMLKVMKQVRKRDAAAS